MLGSNQVTRLPNGKQRSGGKIGKQTITSNESCEKLKIVVRILILILKSDGALG